MSGYTSTRPYLIRALHEWMGDNALTAHIVVDATVPGVQVPPGSVRDGQVILNISMQATHRLELGNERLRFAARFGGREQWVEVPVDAVVAIFARENGQGMTFDGAPGHDGAAVPPGLDAESDDPESGADAVPPPGAPPGGIPAGPRGLKPAIAPDPAPDASASGTPTGTVTDGADGAPPDDPPPPPPRGRPTLKVVK